MFVTRFWFFLLAAALGLVVAVMYLLQDAMDAALRKNVDAVVRSDYAQVQAGLKLQARGHLDRLSEVTADEALREAMLPLAEVSLLHPASQADSPAPAPGVAAGPKSPTENEIQNHTAVVRRALAGLLEKYFGDVRQRFLLAMNRRGEVIAHEGSFPPPEVDATRPFGLYGFPTTRAVLRGYERDDVWFVRVKGKPFLYQVAGRPVVHQGRYVGAVFLGRPIDNEFAKEIRAEANLTGQLFFFVGDTIMARATGGDGDPEATSEAEPGVVTAAVQREAPEWLEYVRTPGGREVVSAGDGYRGVIAPLRGQAVESGAGFMVLRPLVAVGSPWTVLKSASKESLEKVPVVWISLLGVAALLLAMVWIYLERDRPLGQFRKHATILKNKENERFNAYLFRGKYRQIAQDVNAAMDKTVKAVSGAARATAPDVASILGHGGGLNLGSSPIADFDDEEDRKPEEPPAPPTVADLSILGGGPRTPAAPPVAAPPTAAPAVQPAAVPPPAASPHAFPPRAAPPAAPPPHVPPPPPVTLPSMAEPEAVDADEVLDEGPEETPEEPTRIVAIPSELLAAAQGKSDPSDRHEAELKKLFGDFRSTKLQCGESVEGLTFEKFKASVEKNRSSIMQKHKYKDVRFSVYVKAGKAALKATPVL